MKSPTPGGPSNLESIRDTVRPVCLPEVLPLPVLFPDGGDSRHRCTGTQLAPWPTQVYVSPSEPARTDTVYGKGGRGAGLVGCTLLAHLDLVLGPDAPCDSPLWRIPLWKDLLS